MNDARRARTRARALFATVTALAAVAFSGCCHTVHEDLCTLVDNNTVACPSAEDFTKQYGYEVEIGPDEKHLIDDMRTQGTDATGALCCYHVKLEVCGTRPGGYWE